jgi:hypothetical protein
MISINLITVPLSELIKSVDNGEIDKDTLKYMLETFSCKKEPFIENFIRKSSTQAEIIRSSKSYFILDEDQRDYLCALGFYSLSLKVFYISNSISKKKKEKLGVTDNQTHIATYYIALLAKNDTYKEKIEGKLILDSAMGKIVEAMKHVGGKITWVEARKKHQKVIDFYMNNGFKDFQTEEQEDGEYYSHLLKIIKPE